jgi:NADH:ubiquinone oxidoreductase subunit 6 (subunit J)
MFMLRKLILFPLMLLLTVTLLATSIGIAVWGRMWNFSWVTDQVEKHDLYESARDEMYQQVSGEQAYAIEGARAEITVSEEKLQRIFNTIFEPDWIQEQVERFVDELESWLTSKDENFDMKIDLSDMRTNFANEVRAVIEEEVMALPTCTDQQLLDAYENPALDVGCLPPGFTLADVQSEIDDVESKALEQVPTSILLSEMIMGRDPFDVTVEGKDQQAYDDFMQALRQVRTVRQKGDMAALGAIGAILILLVLMLLINIKHIRSFFRWVGTGFFLAGGLGLAIVGLGSWAWERVWEEARKNAYNDMKDVSRDFTDNVLAIPHDFFSGLLNQMQTQMVIILGIGIAAIIVSIIIKKKRKPALANPEPISGSESPTITVENNDQSDTSPTAHI